MRGPLREDMEIPTNLTESHLARINALRERGGQNAINLEIAQKLYRSMTPPEKEAVMVRITSDKDFEWGLTIEGASFAENHGIDETKAREVAARHGLIVVRRTAERKPGRWMREVDGKWVEFEFDAAMGRIGE
jgi:hypothetical protein